MRKNIFTPVATTLTHELFETLLQHPQLKIERIVSAGHSTPTQEWYDQDWDEWVILLQGAAGLRYANGESIDLQPGDYVYLPAHTRHQVSHTTTEPQTIWLAIHFAPPL